MPDAIDVEMKDYYRNKKRRDSIDQSNDLEIALVNNKCNVEIIDKK